MPRRLTALLLALAATGGLAACGGGEEVGDVVPRETPELLPPGEGSIETPEGAADGTATTSTTETTDTVEDAPASAAPPPTTGGGGGGDTGAAAPAPAPAQPAPQPAPESGGTAAPDPNAQPAPDGGQTGGFSDFCAQNPGACGE